MSAILVLASLALVLAGLALWRSARRREAALGLPGGRIVAADGREEPGPTLSARTIRLRGRPDLLVRAGGWIIPIELKTGRAPARPHRGHTLQLFAYCLLIEETSGVRPPYGLLRYPGREFRIPYDDEAEHAVRAVVAAIGGTKAARDEAHRSHEQSGRCGACGFRERCPESLAR